MQYITKSLYPAAFLSILQVCKNIVLAGVGSVKLVDDSPVTEEALSANFLIPPDEKLYAGRSIAEVCCDSLKDFNPMVYVSVGKGLQLCRIPYICSLLKFIFPDHVLVLIGC